MLYKGVLKSGSEVIGQLIKVTEDKEYVLLDKTGNTYSCLKVYKFLNLYDAYGRPIFDKDILVNQWQTVKYMAHYSKNGNYIKKIYGKMYRDYTIEELTLKLDIINRITNLKYYVRR